MQEKIKKVLNFLSHNHHHAYLLSGSIILLVGITNLNGGTVGYKLSPTGETNWIDFGDFPKWTDYLFIWVGFDMMLSQGNLTNWILKKTLTPIINQIRHRIKTEKLGDNADSK